jgi:hypothetical protein
MSKNVEKTDRYLKGVALPEHVSHQHRHELRRGALREIERGQTMPVRNRAWKIAAVAALICTGVVGAAVVGVKIRQYRFVGRGADGTYHFSMEPETVHVGSGVTGVGMGVQMSSLHSTDPNHTIDVEQSRRDLEEIDMLRQQDIRELVGVIETEVNGRLHQRPNSLELR